MAIGLGPVNISGTAEERTWTINIHAPAEASNPLTDYGVTVHREIVVRNAAGKVVRRIRSKGEAGEEFPDFIPQFSFQAGEALAIKPNVLDDIRYAVDELCKDRKAELAAAE